MTDYPIIFSAAMIRAMLYGSKTQTRRLAWRDLKPSISFPEGRMAATIWQSVRPGDRLWARESFAARLNEKGRPDPNPRYVKHRATMHDATTPYNEMDYHTWPKKWSPSIHMPRWASRLTLVVTAVKMERLQEIGECEAKAEGAEPLLVYSSPTKQHRAGFKRLWMALHGTEAWGQNPEVVAMTFRVIRANIDAPEARAA